MVRSNKFLRMPGGQVGAASVKETDEVFVRVPFFI
jgi:hypothetical protein